jgi:hypothetical protein
METKTKSSVHLISNHNLEEPEIKNVFLQQRQNDPPAVKVISLVQQQKRETFLQTKRQKRVTSLVVVS